jgi:hypothetical protein
MLSSFDMSFNLLKITSSRKQEIGRFLNLTVLLILSRSLGDPSPTIKLVVRLPYNGGALKAYITIAHTIAANGDICCFDYN